MFTWAARLMEIMIQFFDYILHLDQHLYAFTVEYETWIYGFLFLIIFCETAFVITPFLPGDSLLFSAGTLAAMGQMNIHFLVFLLIIAAIFGDTVNYWIGHHLSPKIFQQKSATFFKIEYLQRTQRFYENYGGKTIIIARFIPIVRTFAPFVAGISNMQYRRFLTYNVIGGILWVGLISYAAYWFGNIPLIKNNFSLVIVTIIGLSLTPILLEWIRYRLKKHKTPST